MAKHANLAVMALLIVGILSGCSSDGPADQASGSANTEESQTTETFPQTKESYEQLVADFVGPKDGGVELYMVRDGKTTNLTSGVATADGTAMTEGQSFRVGSISKTFVATMIMQLVEEGKIDLDQNLTTYLPTTPVGGDSSIRQLLSHQSGIASYTDQPTFFQEVLADREKQYSPVEIIDYVVDAPAGPADEFAYSNTNYILLGQVLEAVDGRSLNAALTARIAEPAGLNQTFFAAPDQPQPEGLVGGWSQGIAQGDPSKEYGSIYSSAWAAGSLLSTTEDLAKFLQSLTDETLVSSTSFEEMTDIDDIGGYGFGVFKVGFSTETDGEGQSGFGHSGAIPGYHSTMAIDPLTGDTLIILTNNDQVLADELAPQILQRW